jgi:hypothetical protein
MSQTSDFNRSEVFIFTLHLSEGRVGKAWEPSEEFMFLSAYPPNESRVMASMSSPSRRRFYWCSFPLLSSGFKVRAYESDVAAQTCIDMLRRGSC